MAALNQNIAALEQRYIELLESRIKALEATNEKHAQVGANSTTNAEEDGKNDADEEPKTTASQNGTETPTKPHEEKQQQRVRYLDSRYNEDGVKEEVASTGGMIQEGPKPDTAEHALTVILQYDGDKKYTGYEIRLDVEGLRALTLYALCGFSVVRHWIHTRSMTFHSDSLELMWKWSTLRELSSLDPKHQSVKDLMKQINDINPSNESSITGPLDSLHVLRNEESLRTAAKDLGHLLDAIQNTREGSLYLNEEKTALGLQDSDDITFRQLWLLFPPGELVVSTVYSKKSQVFIVESMSDTLTREDGIDYKALFCWTYDWDGISFNRRLIEFALEDFKDTKAIFSLSVYPLKYYNDQDTSLEDFRKRLVDRGKKYTNLCLGGSQIFEYEGEVIHRGNNFQSSFSSHHQWQDAPNKDASDASSGHSFLSPSRHLSSNSQPQRQKIKDRVIVDFEAYLKYGPSPEQGADGAPMGEADYVQETDEKCLCANCKRNSALIKNQRIHYDDVPNTENFEEDQWLICPPRVLGYHLNGKKWVEMGVDHIHPILKKKDNSGFSKLQLPKVQKDLVNSLVQNHTSGSRANPLMNDLTEGKGNGLIILLHGPPGVGKTLTAETVAKATGKPLLSVSVSEIGVEPVDVERNLDVWFELAARWQAVMLFDDADVFLESRSNNTADLKRNALVSVLLRALEFYSGILILTTNRIKTIDVAVQSRINLAIRYNFLNDVQKKNIYNNFIDQLTDENADKAPLRNWLDQEEEQDLSPFKKLNGRQVRNVLFSATSLAASDGGKLKLEHIQKILRQMQEFQSEINSMIERAREQAEVAFAPNA